MSSPPDLLPTGPIGTDEALALALRCFSFGRLETCDHICARILAACPKHTPARVLVGLSAHKQYHSDRAIQVFDLLAREEPGNALVLAHRGIIQLDLGRTDEAAASFERALAIQGDLVEALAGLGEARRRQGRGEEALALLAPAVARRPNYSPAYIPYSLVNLDRSMPPGETLPPRRPRAAGPRLTMVSLGFYGRFAQTVNEYIAGRLYAEKYGMGFETPDWIGHRVFTLDDPLLPSGVLPGYAGWIDEREVFARGLEETVAEPLRDRDLYLGGSPVSVPRRADRDRVWSWLTPRPCWARYLDTAEAAVRARGRTLVAVHLRRTDWWDKDKVGEAAYTPPALFLSWLEEAWTSWDDPVLFICSDEPRIAEIFARFRPVTSADFPVRWEGLEYLQDFHVMSRADVLAVSTGSFATTAAALNRTGRLFLRPDAESRGLAPFEPWA